MREGGFSYFDYIRVGLTSTTTCTAPRNLAVTLRSLSLVSGTIPVVRRHLLQGQGLAQGQGQGLTDKQANTLAR